MKHLNPHLAFFFSGVLLALSTSTPAQEVRSSTSMGLAVDFTRAANTPSEMVITEPVFEGRGFVPTAINSDEIKISGVVRDENGFEALKLNGRPIVVSPDGNFTVNHRLNFGINSIYFEMVDRLGVSTFKEYLISRKQGEMTMGLNASGKYYALLIGINEYDDDRIGDLDEPVGDAEELANTLVNNYTFDRENVTVLKDASYVEVIAALDEISRKVTSDDNLLVFYAGHGHWDSTRELGYWLPGDAQKENTAFWIPNSRISDYMASIDSKHTLLIADACFSGSIFKTRSFVDAQPGINKLYGLSSRKAMTSGTLNKVPDKSVFLNYLVKRLKENPEKYLPSENLFSSMRMAVLNNGPNIPQYGTVQNAGDEGGDFIFIRR